MRKIVVMAAALLAAPVVLTGGPDARAAIWGAQATAGTPIQGTPIGLEGDPGQIHVAAGDVDGDGRAELVWNRKPGATGLSVFVADRSKLRVAAIFRIESGRQTMVSAPILPGKGRGYASDARGKRLIVLPAGGPSQPVRITLTQAPVAPRPAMTLVGDPNK